MKRREADVEQPPRALPRMMIAFIVRRCTIELGHTPTPVEFAAWANAHGDEGSRRLFGRAISADEARVILKHQARLVSAKSARPDEEFIPSEEHRLRPGANVIALAEARFRSRSKRRPK